MELNFAGVERDQDRERKRMRQIHTQRDRDRQRNRVLTYRELQMKESDSRMNI